MLNEQRIFEPKTIYLGTTIFVSEVAVGDKFAAALTRKGDIYIISEHFAFEKLKINIAFRSVMIKGHRLFAISLDGDQIIEWEYLPKLGHHRNQSSFITPDTGNPIRVSDLDE